ncbi:phosphoribosylformylglycinamidine cyclo-ligase [candidate division KSB1 bacterium]|nr:phosphoribosylformylglycinamidine cyclo-ligase [candidate division KSB1 bacterium]
MSKGIGYKDAGVDIKAGEEAVQRIKSHVRSTFTPQVLTDIGKFGGFYQLDLSKYTQPVLVSSVDGVGTKLKVAFMMEKHDTIGEDLVNHCINDILVGGARPLFFLDYIGTGVLQPAVVEQIIQGMVRGCKQAGCALVGGEMAEMPGFYQAGEYDVAGSIVGMVEKSKVIQGNAIQLGDVLIGLPSTGLHTNGYSLARKVLFEVAGLSVHDQPDELDQSVGEALLQVHRCYLPVVDPLLDTFPIKGMSHVTGGGIVGNTSRILPNGRSLQINWNAWEIPPIFRLIQKLGQVSDEEMRKSFNLGIGYIFIVHKSDVDSLVERLRGNGEYPIQIGEVQ